MTILYPVCYSRSRVWRGGEWPGSSRACGAPTSPDALKNAACGLSACQAMQLERMITRVAIVPVLPFRSSLVTSIERSKAMTLADAIYERCVKLPDEAAREALDFIDFLASATARRKSPQSATMRSATKRGSRPRCNGRWTIRVPESTMIKFASTLPTAAKPCASTPIRPAKLARLCWHERVFTQSTERCHDLNRYRRHARHGKTSVDGVALGLVLS